jgi:hypothetical protein
VYDSDDAPNGTADLPHGGRAPSWLFGLMTKLARAIEGRWTVIQQGMNAGTRYARRYHSARTSGISSPTLTPP